MSVALKDAVERVLWTFGQAFVAVLLGSNFFDDLSKFSVNLDAVHAAGLAGIAAVVAVVKTVLAVWVNRRRAQLEKISPASTVSV